MDEGTPVRSPPPLQNDSINVNRSVIVKKPLTAVYLNNGFFWES